MGMMRAVEMITYKMYAMRNVSLVVFIVKGLINGVCVAQYTSTHLRTTCDSLVSEGNEVERVTSLQQRRGQEKAGKSRASLGCFEEGEI